MLFVPCLRKRQVQQHPHPQWSHGVAVTATQATAIHITPHQETLPHRSDGESGRGVTVRILTPRAPRLRPCQEPKLDTHRAVSMDADIPARLLYLCCYSQNPLPLHENQLKVPLGWHRCICTRGPFHKTYTGQGLTSLIKPNTDNSAGRACNRVHVGPLRKRCFLLISNRGLLLAMVTD